MTKFSRWFGLLEVAEGPFIDHTPIFYSENDPFIVRFKVKTKAWLPVEKAVPIHEDRLWNVLSFTKGQNKNSSAWTGKLRGSLVRLSDDDGKIIETAILSQLEGGEKYPVDAEEYRKLLSHRIRRPDKDVTVTVPEDTGPERGVPETAAPDIR